MKMNLQERLDKHLKSIKEVSELNAQEIEKALYKYADTKNLGKLIWALIRPTVQAGGGRFISPSFTDIKQPLLADIKDESKVHRKCHERLYIKFIDIIQKLFFKDGAGLYEKTVKGQLNHYLEKHNPDGELIFLLQSCLFLLFVKLWRLYNYGVAP